MEQHETTPEFPETGPGAQTARGGSGWQSALGAVHRVLDRTAATFVFAILSAMSVVVLAGVISRYVFNDALSWSEEFAIWSFTWLIFTGAAVALGRGGHVAMEVVSGLLPQRLRRGVDTARDAAIFLTLVTFVTKGLVLVEMVGGQSPTLGIPNPVRYGIIPASGLLGAIQDEEDRERLSRLTAVMSLLEGHANVVMDGVGPSVIPSVAAIRKRFDQRRQTPSAAIISVRMPSRRPRSATRSRFDGQTRRIASRMAQPARTRSARSAPMQGLATRSSKLHERSRAFIASTSSELIHSPSTRRRS